MKQRRTCRGASLMALRNTRAALAAAKREGATERKRAILCALQRDFYAESIQYLEEYAMFLPKTMEELAKAKSNFRLFAERRGAQYASIARPYAEELSRGRQGDWLTCLPYGHAIATRRRGEIAIELRAN